MQKIKDYRDFISDLKKGINYYRKSKSRLEHLTLGLPQNNFNSIEYLERFLPIIESHYEWGIRIAYCGVIVQQKDRQHIHMLWKKPFLHMTELKSIWQKITDENTHISNKTFMNKKKQVDSIEENRLVVYLADQSTHHMDLLTSVNAKCFYFKSEFWGLKMKRQKYDPDSLKWNKRPLMHDKIPELSPEEKLKDMQAWEEFKKDPTRFDGQRELWEKANKEKEKIYPTMLLPP